MIAPMTCEEIFNNFGKSARVVLYSDALAAAQGEVDMLREYITPNEGECQIGKEPWPDQCCCRCKYLLIDYWHCTRMPEEMKESDHCGCEKVRGYICIAGEIHGDKSGNSGWPHHSKGCECFTKREIAADALNGGKP